MVANGELPEPLHSVAGTVDTGEVVTEVPTGSAGCVVPTINVEVLTVSVGAVEVVKVVEVVKLNGAHSSVTLVVLVAASTDVETISATTVDGIELVSTLAGSELGATELGGVVAGAELDGSVLVGTEA